MTTPSVQPQLEPILLPKPIQILHRLPCHTSIDTNHEVKQGCPKVRATLNVYDEEVHGYGMTRDQGTWVTDLKFAMDGIFCYAC